MRTPQRPAAADGLWGPLLCITVGLAPSGASSVYLVGDPLYRILNGLVTPYPDDRPAAGLQLRVRSRVASAIGLQFLPTPGGISLWPRHINGACMPEAAIDVYRDAPGRK